MNAIVVGATGLVGRELVRLLLNSKKYDKIIIIVRRKINIIHPRLEQQLISFDHLHECPAEWFVHSDVFCTLGTTIKKAKSKENFKKVDYHYVVELAKLAEQYRSNKMLVITAMGASEQSMFYYSKIKGMTEKALQQMSLQQLIIVRPSLIVGNRLEFRFGEWMAAKASGWLSFMFKGKMIKYKPNTAKDIALALVKLAQFSKDEFSIIDAEAIPYWARVKIF